MSLCSAGDHVLVSRSVFGATVSLFEKYFKRFGVQVDYVPLTDFAAWDSAFKENTKLVFVESPSNPLAELVDIAALAHLCHGKGHAGGGQLFLHASATAAAETGADIVIHSATKYIDGQGRCLGGVVAGRSEQMKEIVGFLRTAGPTLSPFNAWVFLKGLETLRLRMQAHCASAQILAEWLEQQPGVERVFYAGLPSHPQHELAKRQQKGFGAVLSFEVVGGKEGAGVSSTPPG